jgi:riboflavin transporter FmnP
MLQSKHGHSLSVTRRLTLTAVFAALAFASVFVFHFKVSFLTFDLKDAIITLAGLLLGPMAALSISFLVPFLELITFSETGWYGFIMNFASSAVFSVVCSVIYRYMKKLSGAIISLSLGLVAMVAVMMGLNLVVTPLFTGVSGEEVAGMIPTLLLPFNVVKGVFNASLVLIFYKPVRRAMQAAHIMPRSPMHAKADVDTETKKKRTWVSVTVSLAGLLLLAVAIVVFIFVLHGHFEFFG